MWEVVYECILGICGIKIFFSYLLWFYRYPYVTGTSVVALKYKDGILMAADMGGEGYILCNLFRVCLFTAIVAILTILNGIGKMS